MGKRCILEACRKALLKRRHFFSFPKARSQRESWMQAVGEQANWKGFLCENHFAEEDFIALEKCKTGNVTKVRKTWSLLPNATPTKFPGSPPTLAKLKNTVDCKCCSAQIENKEIYFKNFKDIMGSKASFLRENFEVKCTDDFIFIYSLKFKDCPYVYWTIKINSSLRTELYLEKTKINNKFLKPSLGPNFLCNSLSKLLSLLTFVENCEVDTLSSSIEHKLKSIATNLLHVIEDEKDQDKNGKQLEFLRDQLVLSTSSQPRYAPQTVLFAAQLFFNFPGAYDFLRNSEYLSLPSRVHLKSFTGSNINSGVAEDYLNNRFKNLELHEKYIVLLLDEIYVKPKLTYKGSKLEEVALNDNPEDDVILANTVQAFMASSLLSRYKEIVGLYPVKKMTGADLFRYTKNILEMLSKVGFEVVAVIADNNKVNVNLFKSFSLHNQLQPYIIYPFDSSKKIFFIFDSVHIAKNLRSNWLNLEPSMFCFPDFMDHSIYLTANFNDLRKIYTKEKGSTVKLAPGLSLKSLYPTSLEKQSVPLALKIFDDKTVSAVQTLETYLGPESRGTHAFLSVIRDWWMVVNVKSPNRGYRIRNNLGSEITSVKDESYIFLTNFLSWLSSWDGSNEVESVTNFTGKLTKETATALTLTTSSFILISEYLLNTLNFKYVLLGKLQTDPIENRFSKYRRMSGSNYNVSVQQLLESENRIKITSYLKFVSNKKGIISIKNLKDSFTPKDVYEVNKDLELVKNIIDESRKVDVSFSCRNSLIYVAGYVARKINDRIICGTCKSIFTSELDMDAHADENLIYIRSINRGGLKYPSDVCLDLSFMAYQVFQTVISNAFERKFIELPNQKQFLMFLMESKFDGYTEEICDECEVGWITHIKMFSSTWANIFLNSYSKEKSDLFARSNQRKLATLY